MRTFLTILGGFFLTACLLLAGFEYSATDAELYYETQLGCAVDAGITGDEMLYLDTALADYLSGDETALARAGGFGEREISHMRDVFDLFSYLRVVISAAAAMAAICLTAGLISGSGRTGRLKLAAWAGPAILYLPIASIALWAALDFNSAFLAMHELLFNNDLWLLPPESLMIRMLPEEFFSALAGKLLLRAGLVSLAAPILLRAFAVDMGLFVKRLVYKDGTKVK